MSNTLQLIVGLGNPGPDYAGTRHNAGAAFVEEIARAHQITLSNDSKFFGLLGRGVIEGHDVRLLIPMTFMNRSGRSIAAVCQFYKLDPSRILIAHDELDLDAGIARFKQGGGHGGHNGLRDTISSLGNDRGFHRLRIGIGHPGHSSEVVGYVLKRAPAAEQTLIEDATAQTIKILPEALAGNWSIAMNRLHSYKP